VAPSGKRLDPPCFAFVLRQQYSQKALQQHGIEALKGPDKERALRMVAVNDLMGGTLDMFIIEVRSRLLL
jgi:hypothetical protein